ncbi:MAG: terminase family protein [Thermodesulfobacteriota bacterium]
MSGPLFYPYQRRWVSRADRFKVGMFARQTGKTFTTTFEIAEDCQLADLEGRRVRWVILSRGERQAKEAMEEGVKRHCQALGAAIRSEEYEWRGEAAYKALEVTWPNGSRLTALPANPDTARGFSANVFLDEFAFHADSRKIWAALFPVISAGWKLRVVSTPNGKGNKFYDLVTADDPVWYRQKTDIYEAVKDGLPRDVDELKRALGDPDAWAQEYELQWLDEASAWLPYDLINAVEHDQAGDPEGYAGGPCYVGNDIGVRRDLWVAWVWELVGDVLWTREVVTLKRASFATQDATLDDLFGRYRVARLCMDQTGMGEKPVEDAKRRYGASRVEGVLFTGPAKLTLATQGKQAFEDRKIRIPMGDPALRADLHSLKKLPTGTGNFRFDADRDDTGHADRAWACFLGVHAAATPCHDTTVLSGRRRETATMFEGY